MTAPAIIAQHQRIRDTRTAALPSQAGTAATTAAPPSGTQSKAAYLGQKPDGATDEALAQAHGTDPAWTLREIAKAKGATE